MLTSLCFDSYAYLRHQKHTFHELSLGLGDLELEEIEDNLGRDSGENHKNVVNALVDFDEK